MTHMHIPTVPTARDRRKARQAGGVRRRIDVEPDHVGPYDVTDTPGGHRAHRRDCAPDWVSTARCTGERPDPWASGRCEDTVCPKHVPEAYSWMARHVTGTPTAVRT